jgi:transmembrane 9 superfamily protein 2/4
VGFVAATPKKKKPQHYLFNHVRIIVRYNKSPNEADFAGTRIVGFEVIPFSIKHEYEASQANFNKDATVLNTCNQFNPAQFNPDKFQPVELTDEEVRHSLCLLLV